MPSVVVMDDCPERPPTTFTDSADTVPDPPTVNAELLLELSYRLHPLRVTCAFPCTAVALAAVGSRESTQPFPPLPTATERAEMVTGPEAHIAENCRFCDRLKITSTAFGVVVCVPDAGGWLTVTLTPLVPSTKPYPAATACACRVRPVVLPWT